MVIPRCFEPGADGRQMEIGFAVGMRGIAGVWRAFKALARLNTV
jgi:hypothetical protein